MPIKKIDEITDKQIKDNGVQALADRPNLPNQYGASGLSASQLKAWFDKLATFLAHRINEITNALSSEDAASYIGVAMAEYESLADLIEAFSNGEFADTLMVNYSISATEKKSLQTVLTDMAEKLADYASNIEQIDGTVNEHGAKLDEHGEALVKIQDKIDNMADLWGDQFVDLSSEQTITGAKTFTGNTNVVADYTKGARFSVDAKAGENGEYGRCKLEVQPGLVRINNYDTDTGFNDAYANYTARNISFVDFNISPSPVILKFPPPPSDNKATSGTIATQEWVQENGGGKLYRHNIVFYHTDAKNVVHTIRLEYISKKSTAYTSVVEFANEFTENYNGVVSYNGGFGNGACQLVIDKTVGFGFNVNGAVFYQGNINGVYISVYGEQLIASQITITDTVTEI